MSSQDADQAKALLGLVSCWGRYLQLPKAPMHRCSSVKVSHSSAALQIHASEADVRQLCRVHDLTASNIFQLAWVLVLRAYIGSESILFGFLSSGRDLPIAGIQKPSGPVANMLPFRSEIRRDMKAIDVAKSLQADYIEHLSRQTLPLAEIGMRGARGIRAPASTPSSTFRRKR